MNRKTILTLGTSAMLALGLIGGAATLALADGHSARSDAAEGQAFLVAPGSISAAITAVEAQTNGRAMSAEFEGGGDDAGWYSVEVVAADGTTSEMLFNPVDGTIKPAPADNDDDGEHSDDT